MMRIVSQEDKSLSWRPQDITDSVGILCLWWYLRWYYPLYS